MPPNTEPAHAARRQAARKRRLHKHIDALRAEADGLLAEHKARLLALVPDAEEQLAKLREGWRPVSDQQAEEIRRALPPLAG